ncbi:hypothetical protein [Rufibacter soli]
MLSVKFYLHPKANKEGYRPLNIIVHADGFFRPGLKMAIGEKVKTENWNHEKQVVKAKGKNSLEINARLERIEAKVSNRFRELLDAGTVPTKRDLEELVRPATALKKAKALDPQTPRETWVAWSAWYLEEKNLGNKSGKVEGHNYVRKGKQVVEWLEKFDPALKMRELADKPGGVMGRTGEYRKWLLKNSAVQDVTINKHISIIKAWLTYLGLPTDNIKNRKAPKPVKTALSWAEVMQLYHKEYANPRMRMAVDAFVANTQVSLRFEDMLKPNAASILEMHAGKRGKVTAINLNQGKTGDLLCVPLPPMALSILSRYNFQFPVHDLVTKDKEGRPRRNAKSGEVNPSTYNTLLKAAAKEAGLKRQVRTVKVTGGHVEEGFKEVHELISSHMARHTGFTLVKMASKDNDLADAQLGHANDSPYMHHSPEVLLEALLSAWLEIEKAPEKKETGL